MRRPVRQRERGPLLLLRQGGPLPPELPAQGPGLPRSAPFVEDKGGRRDDTRWKGQPPTRQEWGKSRYKEEWGPPPPQPPKGNGQEPWREEPGQEGGPRRDQRGGATQALEEEDRGDAAPEMNVLCEADSDGEEGLFGLREGGDISHEEATAAFSSDEEEEDEEGAEEVGVVHMLTAGGNLRPGPAYVRGRLGGRAEYVKIMIDSGNTVGDLVSEEFAQRLGLEGDKVRDHITVPTTATATTATTVLVVKRCREVTANWRGLKESSPSGRWWCGA